MHTTEPQLSPTDPFRELASILAAGLLRLNTRPQIANESAISSAERPPDFGENPLGFPSEKRLHVPGG